MFPPICEYQFMSPSVGVAFNVNSPGPQLVEGELVFTIVGVLIIFASTAVLGVVQPAVVVST
ncbi:hypothetical protein D3C85_1800840 [compost metagenome]